LLRVDQVDCLRSQFDLADFSGDGHGKFVDDGDVARDLVVGDLSSAELTDRFGGGVSGTILDAQPGHQLFAVLFIGNPHDLCVEDVGVCVAVDSSRPACRSTAT